MKLALIFLGIWKGRTACFITYRNKNAKTKIVQCFDKFTSAMVLKACDECFNEQQPVERQCNKGTKIQQH